MNIERFQLWRITLVAAGLLLVGNVRATLNMPPQATGPFPKLLSQTGAFADTAGLVPAKELLPYDLNVSFWADGALKHRWMVLPANGKIHFAATGDWAFPAGTIFVKHFDLATNDLNPAEHRRLETRLLVRTPDGSVYGATYKWRPDNSDADLLPTNLLETIAIKTATGTRSQTWYYPSREDCRTCHTDRTGGVLGVKARQINRDSQLQRWNEMGLFDVHVADDVLASCDRLAGRDDTARSLEDRARSYLDANCSNCHRPGGTVAYFDARYDTLLAKQGLIEGQILLDEGIDGACVIAPHDIWRSILFMRARATDALKMPPLAHEALDAHGMDVLKAWIQSMPGTDVLPPPAFSVAPGNYAKPVNVTLSEEVSGATIRYTLDGSRPTSSDPVFEKPIYLKGPATIRAKAFKTGWTKSIITQATYIIGE